MPDKSLPKVYFAPLEGITTRVYRDTHRKHFPGTERYYTPFLAANQTHHFKKREQRDLLPFQEDLVPQILTASGKDFIWAAGYIRSLGYEEVNLNLGCPYPTVFTKGKGAGMLADTDKLKRFFEEIFSASGLPFVSVKTRIGVRDPEEGERLAEIFAAYPISEVIIHPRVREEYYEGEVHRDVFDAMRKVIRCPVCYNGDIRTAKDADALSEILSPEISAVMIGRGLIADPSLARQISGGKASSNAELKLFLIELWEAYREVLYGERDVLFKMKELWHYMGTRFPEKERTLLDIKKSKTESEYREAINKVFE